MFEVIKILKIVQVLIKWPKLFFSLQFLWSAVWWPYIQSECWY